MTVNPIWVAPHQPQPDRPVVDVSWSWATVTDNSPLTVRLDGHTAALGITPETLVDPSGLGVADRVWVQMFGRRVIIIGRAY